MDSGMGFGTDSLHFCSVLSGFWQSESAHALFSNVAMLYEKGCTGKWFDDLFLPVVDLLAGVFVAGISWRACAAGQHDLSGCFVLQRSTRCASTMQARSVLLAGKASGAWYRRSITCFPSRSLCL